MPTDEPGQKKTGLAEQGGLGRAQEEREFITFGRRGRPLGRTVKMS